MLPEYSVGHAATVFTLAASALTIAICAFSWCVRPLRRRIEATETYECGMKAEGNARGIGFNYIQYAALFLLFDLAALFLFLYAVLDRPSVAVNASFLAGLLTLGLALLYATKGRRYHVA